MYEIGKDIIKNAGATGGGSFGPARNRLRFIYGCLIALFFVFGAKTLLLGIEGTDRQRRGTGSGQWTVSRADIIDRNGDIIAKNILSGNIVLRPQKVSDPDAAALFIHQTVPDVSVSQVLDIFESGKRFVYIKKLASESQREAVKQAKIKGIDVEPVEWRRYPKRRLFSHIVGFVGADMRGLEGIERIKDEYLRDNTAPLVLSLDSRIQSAMYENLSAAMQKFQAKGAMGMLMNSRTGEMLSIAALPDYDPENLDIDPVANRMFRPMRGVYEIGSIFKIFNTAMAMETGIGLTREYPISKPFQIHNKNGRVSATIRDVASFKPPRPNLTVSEIMLYSCNVGSAQIALDLPEGTQQEFFSRIHMDRALDLEFGRTERSLMPIKWGPVEKATVSFGHGISVTPMHVLLAVNAMTNGGIYIMPTILKRSVGEMSGQRIISPHVSEHLRQIMFKIAEETTAKQARIAGINVGGKTGTAEKRINGTIDRKKNLTAFIGIFPVEAPQYIIFIVLDEPQGTKESWGLRTAAWNAVPTAGAIMESIMPMLF